MEGEKIDERRIMNEREFEQLVAQALPIVLDVIDVDAGRRIGSARPDFVVSTAEGRTVIVEVKAFTPSTQTRLAAAAAQLLSYRESLLVASGHPYPDVDLVLAIPGSLAPQQQAELRAMGISRVLDGPSLRAAAPGLPWPDAVGASTPDRATGAARAAMTLLARLDTINPGRAQWSDYQKFVGQALAYLLVPPLAQPLSERSTRSKANRRDFILPNYATDGFWHFMRTHYEAHFIVVDAKNYTKSFKKSEVLQIANYLSPHGAGLFGIIICRQAADGSAEVTRREQWALNKKMIVVLNDADLRQMFEFSLGGQDASEVIRQKIEDFRLGF